MQKGSNKAYRVVSCLNGRNNPATEIISYHRTFEAAQEKIDQSNRGLHPRSGLQRAWRPWAIQVSRKVEFEDGSSDIQWEYTWTGE
jgi:hypothetical protein